MSAAGWAVAALGLAGVGFAFTGDGGHGPGLAALGGAVGLLAQAGWSALRLAGAQMLAETRLEEPVGRPRAFMARPATGGENDGLPSGIGPQQLRSVAWLGEEHR